MRSGEGKEERTARRTVWRGMGRNSESILGGGEKDIILRRQE